MSSTATLTKRPVAASVAASLISSALPKPTAARIQAVKAAKAASDRAIHRADHKTFTWSETDEPHATRRRLIMAAHPEIMELFGPEPLTLPIVILIVAIQLAMAYWAVNMSWPLLFFCAWAVGGTLNHSLQLAVHELSHNLALSSPWANSALAIFANMPTGFASAITFQKYHMDHHSYQGVDGIDTDIPVEMELNIFTNALMKMFWVFLQPLFYAFRPVLVKPKPLGMWEMFNWMVSLSFDALVVYTMGVKAFIYLVSGTLLGLGLHPAAGHFIAEHYEFVKGQETYSYYGFWNFFNFNVGYHNEHHDFPKVAWSRLPAVKRMAPEFYDVLPCYTSYISVFWRYISDPEVGPFARVKRVAPDGAARVEEAQEKARKDISPAFRIISVFLMGCVISFIVYAAMYL